MWEYFTRLSVALVYGCTVGFCVGKVNKTIEFSVEQMNKTIEFSVEKMNKTAEFSVVKIMESVKEAIVLAKTGTTEETLFLKQLEDRAEATSRGSSKGVKKELGTPGFLWWNKPAP